MAKIVCFLLLSLLVNLSQSLRSPPLQRRKLVRSIPLSYGETKPDPNQAVPYVVALDFRVQHTYWFCAGSIIAPQWILTVASCTLGATHVNISYGAADRRKPLMYARVPSSSFYPHPDFSDYNRNDIALIEGRRVSFTTGLAAVGLPDSAKMFTNTWAQVAGWGEHSVKDGNSNNILQVLKIEITANKVCKHINYGRRFRPQMLCGQMTKRGSNCQLDSGSPMVVQRPVVLVGIASLGTRNGCRYSQPFGFTRVSSYMNWIASVMRRSD